MPVLIPRDYQEEGIRWLHNIKRGFLTDWPGLGKTIQAAEAAELPAMIFGPTHLTGQWADFLREQYPDLKIGFASGTRKERDRALAKNNDFYVANYEMAATYAFPNNIKTFINDESHHLRNRGAKKSRAIALLENRDPKARIYNVTASPMWKSIDDIWMQLHILYPKIFTSWKQFVDSFCISYDTPYGPKVLGVNKYMKEELDSILKPIMFGRTYTDVGRFLPPVVENVVTLEFPPHLQKMYKDLKRTYQLQYEDEEGRQKLLFSAMGMMHTLRQITMMCGKIEAVKNIVEDVGKPHVIGTWYVDHAQMIHKAIPNSVFLDGSIPPVERQQKALRAQNEGKHIVTTEAALCEGVNLSKYKNVILVEEHYPPGANFQFISRAARDRNDNGADQDPVLVTCIHVRRSIDTAIHGIAKTRQGSIKDVVEAALV